MSKVSYSKKPLTYEQQLKQLQERGLKVANKEKALHLLENISYYRLSGYWYPMLKDKRNHQFKEGATFRTAFKLYCFDRELRKMLVGELEKIEISFRAKMIHVLSLKHGPFWFEEPDLFNNPVRHANSLSKIGEEYKRSDEEFVRAFKKKYSNALPPSWMTLEITSFGALSMMYKNLKPSNEKRELAHYFGLPDKVFATWFHSMFT